MTTTLADTRSQIWSQSAAGAVISLTAPSLAGLDLVRDLIETIARLCRFIGHVPGSPYSVAQHCVIGADAAFGETGSAWTAAAVLLHDLHEAFLGDIATPVADALRRETGDVIREAGGDGAAVERAVRAAVHRLKARIDAVIYPAAGLAWPLDPTTRAYVARMDLRLLATERKYLLAPSPQPWALVVELETPLSLARPIVPWTWVRAAREYHDRIGRYCPALLDI